MENRKIMKPKIYIALVDDWELRGNGTGCVEELQCKPMRKLMDIYESHNIHCTFNVEVMQQIYMRKYQEEYTELKEQADAWDTAVLEAFRRGHDIQLHIHPQWKDAVYINGKWVLNDNWDITKYQEADVRAMFTDCISYLKELLPSTPPPHFISFRSGSWFIAPSDFMMQVLIDKGIKIDMTIVGGFVSNTKHGQLDYSKIEEDFLPYYPDMHDARKVSGHTTEIVCMPTFNFIFPLVYRIPYYLKKIVNKLRVKGKSVSSDGGKEYNEWIPNYKMNLLQRINSEIKRQRYIADLANLSKIEMLCMIKSLYKKSKMSGKAIIPVIIENHTKNLSNPAQFYAIDKFVTKLVKDSNIHFVTISDLNEMLQGGMFPIVGK
jgi:hypothetical protein